MHEMLEFHKEKTKKELPFYVLKSLCFFEDAEHDFDPEMMIDLSWDEIKSIFRKAVEEVYLN